MPAVKQAFQVHRMMFQALLRPLTRVAVSLLLVAVASSGCQRRLPLAPVSGRITLEGQPLVGGTITTQPMAQGENTSPGPGSWGKTDAEGRYQLELVEPALKGAIVGQHRVMITRAPGSEDDPWSDSPRVERDNSWPAKFTDGSLSLDVPAKGRDDADFELRME